METIFKPGVGLTEPIMAWGQDLGESVASDAENPILPILRG